MSDIRGDDVRVACPLFHTGSGGSIPTSPLQLFIREICMSEARLLNALWHSVLPNTHPGNLSRTRHNVCYGAEFDGIFYAAAIWTTPIASNRLKDGLLTLELRRLAISADAPRNTASRMICIMSQLIKKKFPNIIKLISYQSTQHHKGTIYSASGWTAAAK